MFTNLGIGTEIWFWKLRVTYLLRKLTLLELEEARLIGEDHDANSGNLNLARGLSKSRQWIQCYWIRVLPSTAVYRHTCESPSQNRTCVRLRSGCVILRGCSGPVVECPNCWQKSNHKVFKLCNWNIYLFWMYLYYYYCTSMQITNFDYERSSWSSLRALYSYT